MKKFFKKIGGGIKKAFGKVGKFMGKLGWIGQLAMMFVPVPGLGSIMNAAFRGLGKVGNIAANVVSKIPGGQKIVEGAQFMIDKAKTFKNHTKQKFGNISDTISEYYDTSVNFVKDKLGLPVDTQMQQHESFVEAGVKGGEGNVIDPRTGRQTSEGLDIVEGRTEAAQTIGSGRTARDIARDEAETGTGITSLLVEPGKKLEILQAKSGREGPISVDKLLESVADVRGVEPSLPFLEGSGELDMARIIKDTPSTDLANIDERPRSLLGSEVREYQDSFIQTLGKKSKDKVVDTALEHALAYAVGPPDEVRGQRTAVVGTDSSSKFAGVPTAPAYDAYQQYVSNYPIVPGSEGMYPSNVYQQTFGSLRP